MKNRFSAALCALLMIVLFWLPVHGNAEARQEGRKWAVVVGIDNYMYEVTPLRCAVNDAEMFSQALTAAAGFDNDDIFLLTSENKGNRLPTYLNIVKWISYIREKASPDDVFVLFFSGHGMDFDNEFPAAIDRFERLFALFPDQPEYSEIKTMLNGIGEWTTYASLLIFSARGRAIVRRDGTCCFIENGKAPDEGRWTIKSLKERTFHCQFQSGMWCDLKLSDDGVKAEGHLNNRARVIMNRVPSK